MNYKKGPIIGRGSTATVSVATTITGDLFAVKSTELSKSSFLQKEQQLLSKLSSPHIINYIGFDIDYIDHVPMYNMFMEYAPNGTISDVTKKHGGSLDECLIRSYTHQILLGLDYLHSNNIVHCDIKCSNILVCKDSVKIGDLGCAKLVDNNNNTNITDDTSCELFSGTPVFMAPEVARGEKQGFAADVWAVGCAVIEMATGSNPWPEINNPVSGLYRIGYSGDVPLFPVWLSEEGKDFLKKCLQGKDEERWTVKELLQHPFVSFNSCYKKIGNLLKGRSPSSVLDQGFWDSFEVTGSQDPTRFVTNSGESPVNRMKELVNTCLPNWVDEEDWIMVRSNQVEESLDVTYEDLYIDVDMEDENSESTRSDSEHIQMLSEMFVEGFSMSVRIIVESNVFETSGASVVNSRFLGLKNIDNDSCLVVDSTLYFVSVYDPVQQVLVKFIERTANYGFKENKKHNWLG